MNSGNKFRAPIARQIWGSKYRLKSEDGTPIDRDLDDTFLRVANAAASVEKGGRKSREKWAGRFFNSMSDLGFIPAGRILAGAGSGRKTTLFNCFVMGQIDDDLGDIFDSLKRAARTMQSGGGIGVDFSTLRPKDALVKSIGAGASGPVSFMGVWDAMCQTIQSAGARRGAMMATMRIDHPDIELFIDAKNQAGVLTNFNLSVLVPDAFMHALKNDMPWQLEFGSHVYKTLRARDLWDQLMRATYDYAEPGVIFIDRVNKQNNLSYCETIFSTNPCGEQPLPPFGACLLGSINLAQLVTKPFSDTADISVPKLEQRVAIAVRLLDNMIDVSNYPLKRQRKEALAKRRMGIGVTGLADALIMCGLGYGTKQGRAMAAKWVEAIQNAAYLASAKLAATKGTFPLFDKKSILNAPNVKRLAPNVVRAIAKHGLRNGCLTSIAPTGTISLLAGNVSSGVEPVWDFTCMRSLLQPDGSHAQEVVKDYALQHFQTIRGANAHLPETFVNASDLSPSQHVAMQAALQPFIDSAISKTINCPQDIPFTQFQDIYSKAYRDGLKGCTTYRPTPTRGAVLTPIDEQADNLGTFDATQAESTPLKAQAEALGTTNDVAPKSGHDPATVVYMAKPLERATQLEGVTYKLKWPQSDHAIYVTINDIKIDGRTRPFEVFINTRNLEHYSWTVALTRMISAVFRRGGDVSFVADELKAVFDPQGGSWIDGRYVPSLLAAIGDIIDTHMRKTGFIAQHDAENIALKTEAEQIAMTQHQQGGDDNARSSDLAPKFASTVGSNGESGSGGHAAHVGSAGPTPQGPVDRAASPPRGRLCPRCSSSDFVRSESCWQCRQCGFSRCD